MRVRWEALCTTPAPLHEGCFCGSTASPRTGQPLSHQHTRRAGEGARGFQRTWRQGELVWKLPSTEVYFEQIRINSFAYPCNSSTPVKNFVLIMLGYMYWVISGKCLAARDFRDWGFDVWTESIHLFCLSPQEAVAEGEWVKSPSGSALLLMLQMGVWAVPSDQPGAAARTALCTAHVLYPNLTTSCTAQPCSSSVLRALFRGFK